MKVSVIFSAQKSKFSWVEVNQNFVKIPESCIQHCARNIAHNGLGLCEVRATANPKSGVGRNSSKNHFHFFKFTKKMKCFFAVTASKFSKISFNPASCKTHVSRSAFIKLLFRFNMDKIFVVHKYINRVIFYRISL